MAERKPGGVSFESWVDRQIREAEERGEFDNLPGAGKPLKNLGRSRDEMWWIREKLAQEGLSSDHVLPTPLKLRKEKHRLRETVAKLASEQQVRDTVAELNARIMNWLRAPSGPQIPIGPADADAVVDQWRADRAATGPPPPTATVVPPEPADDDLASTPPPWWRRLFGFRR